MRNWPRPLTIGKGVMLALLAVSEGVGVDRCTIQQLAAGSDRLDAPRNSKNAMIVRVHEGSSPLSTTEPWCASTAAEPRVCYLVTGKAAALPAACPKGFKDRNEKPVTQLNSMDLLSFGPSSSSPPPAHPSLGLCSAWPCSADGQRENSTRQLPHKSICL